MRELGERCFGELAGRRVVAHRDERRREVRHDRRMLRRALAAPQRFQRFVQIADRVVHPIGEVSARRRSRSAARTGPAAGAPAALPGTARAVGRARRSASARRSRGVRRRFRQAARRDARRSAAKLSVAAAIHRLRLQRMGGEEQMVERDRQLAPRARARHRRSRHRQQRLRLRERGLGIAKMAVPQRRDAIVTARRWPAPSVMWLMRGRTVRSAVSDSPAPSRVEEPVAS